MQSPPIDNNSSSYNCMDFAEDASIILGKVGTIAFTCLTALGIAYVLGSVAVPLGVGVSGVMLTGAALGLTVGSIAMPICCKGNMYRPTKHNLKDVAKYLEDSVGICATSTAIGMIVVPILVPLAFISAPIALMYYKFLMV